MLAPGREGERAPANPGSNNRDPRCLLQVQIPGWKCHVRWRAGISRHRRGGISLSAGRGRDQSDLFTVALPAGNWLGVEPTVTQGVAEGYWLLLAPLPVGEHELRFGGEVPDSDIVTEVTYHLTVGGP